MKDLKTFGPVMVGAGTLGFSGEGYWYHRLVPGLSFEGATLVTKTITTYGVKGNQSLTDSYRPREWFPKCIALFWRMAAALNSVCLSGPSARDFLKTGRWQEIEDPFFISYMPVLDPTDMQYAWETRDFASALRRHLPDFKTTLLGLQLNVSCPNIGADLDKLVGKVGRLLDELSDLRLSWGYRVPIVVKLSLLVSPEAAAEIAKHPACAGLCVANSIPFGTVLSKKWWHRYFPKGSPLERLGFPPGGLTGAPLLNEVDAWLKRFRRIDKVTHVNAGGGIMHPRDVDRLHRAGANSIFFASVAMLRPWRVRRIIRRTLALFGV